MLFDDIWGGAHEIVHGLRHIWRYLCNLQWTERAQFPCVFCAHESLMPVYEDDKVIAFENIRLAGKQHWLIAPKDHIRDIESLDQSDLPLLVHFDKVKHVLLEEHFPAHESVTVLSGYHRGRRPLMGNSFWPDIISIHHLHLHVIVEPRYLLRLFKYPSWLPLMWKSDEQVLRQIKRMEHKQR